MIDGPAVPELWRRILAVDGRSHEYFAERTDWPGLAVFTNAGAPEFNIAVIGDAGGDAGGCAETLLDRVTAHYHGLGLPCRLRVTPLSRPPGWVDRLARRGFRHLPEEDEEFMALSGPVRAEQAAGVESRRVESRRVENEAGLSEFLRVQQAGWGAAPEDEERALRMARRSFTEGLYRYYLAWLDGRPAAAASVRFAEGLAGIYGLATLPEARRRGVGSALVAHIVGQARGEGCDGFFLSVEPGSDAGRLYARLGFEPIFRVSNFVLPPDLPPKSGG